MNLGSKIEILRYKITLQKKNFRSEFRSEKALVKLQLCIRCKQLKFFFLLFLLCTIMFRILSGIKYLRIITQKKF